MHYGKQSFVRTHYIRVYQRKKTQAKITSRLQQALQMFWLHNQICLTDFLLILTSQPFHVQVQMQDASFKKHRKTVAQEQLWWITISSRRNGEEQDILAGQPVATDDGGWVDLAPHQVIGILQQLSSYNHLKYIQT